MLKKDGNADSYSPGYFSADVLFLQSLPPTEMMTHAVIVREKEKNLPVHSKIS